MIRALKRRTSREQPPVRDGVASDASARFAYELATKPPTKDVASVKAATDIFEASLREASPRDERSKSDGSSERRRR